MEVKVWITDTEIWIEREDGTQGFECFADYPRLREAMPEERNAYEVLPYGLHRGRRWMKICSFRLPRRDFSPKRKRRPHPNP